VQKFGENVAGKSGVFNRSFGRGGFSSADFPRTFQKAFAKRGAFEKQTELGLGQHDLAWKMRIYGGKNALFKALGNDDKARAVIEKSFAGRSSLVKEDEQVTRERILLQMVLDLKKQAIKGGSHIGGLLA
jgi:hypothetical protein